VFTKFAKPLVQSSDLFDLLLTWPSYYFYQTVISLILP